MRCDRTIVVVDEDEDRREAMAARFTAEGYGICTAADGATALELLQRHPECDVMVVDCRLPDMDGSTLLRAVRAAPHLATLPIIVLSTDDLTPGRVRAAGGTAFLQEPHDPDLLLAFITHHSMS